MLETNLEMTKMFSYQTKLRLYAQM